MKKPFCALALLLLCLSLTACGNENASFHGSRTSDGEQFMMEYSVLNMTEKRSFALNTGDVIDVDLVSEAGDLSVVIQKGDETPIYRGNGLPTSHFQVTARDGGTYDVAVTGRQAKGSVRFVVQRAAAE